MEKVFNKTNKIIAVLLLLVMMFSATSQVFAVGVDTTKNAGGNFTDIIKNLITSIINKIKELFGIKPDIIEEKPQIEKGTELKEDEKEIFKLINDIRIEHGLEPLKNSSTMQPVALKKAQDMVENNYFAHTSPTYGNVDKMLIEANINFMSCGENLGRYSNNKDVVEAWMNSPSHKANILDSSYSYTGIAVVKSSENRKIYVQMFVGK